MDCLGSFSAMIDFITRQITRHTTKKNRPVLPGFYVTEHCLSFCLVRDGLRAWWSDKTFGLVLPKLTDDKISHLLSCHMPSRVLSQCTK